MCREEPGEERPFTLDPVLFNLLIYERVFKNFTDFVEVISLLQEHLRPETHPCFCHLRSRSDPGEENTLINNCFLSTALQAITHILNQIGGEKIENYQQGKIDRGISFSVGDRAILEKKKIGALPTGVKRMSF